MACQRRRRVQLQQGAGTGDDQAILHEPAARTGRGSAARCRSSWRNPQESTAGTPVCVARDSCSSPDGIREQETSEFSSGQPYSTAAVVARSWRTRSVRRANQDADASDWRHGHAGTARVAEGVRGIARARVRLSCAAAVCERGSDLLLAHAEASPMTELCAASGFAVAAGPRQKARGRGGRAQGGGRTRICVRFDANPCSSGAREGT